MSTGADEGLDENYARAGYHAAQTWGHRPALILIDFAQAYFEPNSPLFGGEGCRTALASALRLRAIAHECGLPVLLTEVIYRKGGADGGVFFRKAPVLSCFVAGSPTQRYAEGLTPREEELIVSQAISERVFWHEPRRDPDLRRRRHPRHHRGHDLGMRPRDMRGQHEFRLHHARRAGRRRRSGPAAA